MKDFFRKNRIIIIIGLAVIVLVSVYSLYRQSKTDLLNKSEMSDFASDIRTQADEGYFTSQEVLSDYITSWADENELEYKKDKQGNIIFTSAAVERKKKLSPTIICISYNYETVRDNSRLLASAAMIAKTELNSGKKTVIFVNDEKNTGAGYRGLSKKLFKNKPKIIYMDYGSSSYISNASFGKKYSEISIKAGRYEPECDTAIKVHISGLTSGVIGTGISKHPDPVRELGALLSRLKSKSAIFQLADFSIGNNGDMYPVSMDATILLNSYSSSSFTKYIDKRIKSWEKSYSGDYEELSYTYELVTDPEDMPEKTYSRTATSRLANVLYTLKVGTYTYDDKNVLPEGRSVGDIYGINAVTGLRAEDGSIRIDLMTQAYNDELMQRIMDDNTAAAELFECKIREKDSIPGFLNDKDSLLRTFRSTYYKINSIISASNTLEQTTDNYFTPCSYLAAKNSNADIIHLRLNSEQTANLTNSILCYIAFKGNILL